MAGGHMGEASLETVWRHLEDSRQSQLGASWPRQLGAWWRRIGGVTTRPRRVTRPQHSTLPHRFAETQSATSRSLKCSFGDFTTLMSSQNPVPDSGRLVRPWLR